MRSANELSGSAPPVVPLSMRARAALAVCREPAHLCRTGLIALVVGGVLTLINELDVFVEGRPTAFTAVKVVLNFCMPFVVSNVGLFLGSRTTRRCA